MRGIMLTVNLNNLVYFVPQYFVSSAIAIIIFIYLEKRFSKFDLFFTAPRRPPRDLTKLDFLFCSPLDLNNWFMPSFDLATYYLDSSGSFSSGLYSQNNKFTKNINPQSYKLDYLKGFYFAISPSSALQKNEIYNNHFIYKILASIYAISAWIGMLLVLTPYSRIQIFIPHFSSSINLIVAIILGIAIFEATISIIVFFTGNSRKWFFYVEGLVFIVASLFFISPSMSWIYGFSVQSRILIYGIITGLILFITFLIFQLESKRNSFLAALYSSGVAYGFFIATVSYNIYIIVMSKI
jgi:hypothetical protein